MKIGEWILTQDVRMAPLGLAQKDGAKEEGEVDEGDTVLHCARTYNAATDGSSCGITHGAWIHFMDRTSHIDPLVQRDMRSRTAVPLNLCCACLIVQVH